MAEQTPSPSALAERSQQLAAAAVAGERQAFDDLVELYAGRLLRYLQQLGLSPSDAEDLAQETFVRAYQHLQRFDPRYAFATWLFTIARRLAYNFWRRQVVPLVGLSLVEAPAPAVSRGPDRDSPLWRAARELLSARHFEVLWLRYGEDMEICEVAKVLETSDGNVRVILHRATRTLRGHLDRQQMLQEVLA